jgi:hypothetical protein
MAFLASLVGDFLVVLQNKWDGPYVVHLVLSNGALTIMDMKVDQFMMNGQ